MGGQLWKRSLELSVQVIYRYTETLLLFGYLAAFEGYFGPLGIFSHPPQKGLIYVQSSMEAGHQWQRYSHLLAQIWSSLCCSCQLCGLEGASLYLGKLEESAK